MLGKGARLFPDGLDRTVLTLTRHEVFDSGIVIPEYGPVAPGAFKDHVKLTFFRRARTAA